MNYDSITQSKLIISLANIPLILIFDGLSWLKDKMQNTSKRQCTEQPITIETFFHRQLSI